MRRSGASVWPLSGGLRAPFRMAAARTGRALLFVAGLGLGVAACAFIPAGVPGFEPGRGWTALPVAAWLTEENLRANAIVFCRAEDCPHPSAVALYEARGPEARAIEEMVQDPQRLARAMNARPRPGQRQRALVEVQPLTHEGRTGFRIAITSRSGAQRAAHGVVLTGRDGPVLWVAVAVSSRPDTALDDASIAIGPRR